MSAEGIVCVVSVILAGAVPYMMLRTRAKDPKLLFFFSLFRWFGLDENHDTAGDPAVNRKPSLTIGTAPHIEAQLQHDMDHIRERLLQMVARDERALTQAFDALLKRDRQLAYSVILRDQEIDALETELDHLCLEFIVRHQPIAAHLRFVYSASKIISQLERVGDYAESIARQVLLLSPIPFDVPKSFFSELAQISIPMLHNAVRAFIDRDDKLARTTMLMEPRANQIRDQIISDIVNWRVEGKLPLEALMPLVTVARRFERVSDQATNICEQALYFATGEYVRHAPRVAFRVLFVDSGNGCLSRLAEAAGNQLGSSRFAFASAVVAPEPPDAAALEFLASKGVNAAPVSAPLAEAIATDKYQVIVALGPEAEEALSGVHGTPLLVQWVLPNPSTLSGPTQQILAGYEDAYQTLSSHIRELMHAILGSSSNSDQN